MFISKNYMMKALHYIVTLKVLFEKKTFYNMSSKWNTHHRAHLQ